MPNDVPTRSVLALVPSQKFIAVLRILEWLVLLVAIAYFIGRTLPRSWQTLNTDFPNYYVTAYLLRDGYNTGRVYEWTWIQRQKDHLGIDQPVIGFIPLTPLSALPVLPLTYLSPLRAKRIWILINLALLSAVVGLLHSMTGLALHRVALFAALTIPIHHNLVLGQMYIVLLAILTLALWAHLRNRCVAAGVLVGVAFGMKVFPALFLLYFIRKREWRSVAGFVLGACTVALLSIAVFGVEMNRTYIFQVLPWALRGEALDPYNLHANSISAVLHHLFIFEPEWNPHPLIDSPPLFAILHPLLQVLVFAPVLLLSCPYRMGIDRTRLEWAVFTVALLAISTSPASYDFTLLLLPATVIASTMAAGRRWRMLAAFIALYLAVCYPFSNVDSGNGWRTMLAVPRLYFLIMLCAFGCVLLCRDASRVALRRDRRSWIAAFALGLIGAIVSNMWHQRHLYDDYRWRVSTSADIFAVSSPIADGNSILFTAMLKDGYRSAYLSSEGLRLSGNPVDQLVQTASAGRHWWEESARTSQVISAATLNPTRRLEISQAEFPVASLDGSWLAFQRSEHGNNRLWLRSLSAQGQEWPITPVELNVMEMAFLPDGAIAFSASAGGAPHLFIGDEVGHVRSLASEKARYPAVSPDGRWLVFSRLQRGMWNLWIRDLQTYKTEAITNAACNNVSPTWEADSKTLLYASDCGRGLWLTALCRRRVVP